MDGRWNLMVTPDGRAPGAAKAPDQAAIRNGWSCVPVVPCDNAALERGAERIDDLLVQLGVDPSYAPDHAPLDTVKRILAEAVLSAAGDAS